MPTKGWIQTSPAQAREEEEGMHEQNHLPQKCGSRVKVRHWGKGTPMWRTGEREIGLRAVQ